MASTRVLHSQCEGTHTTHAILSTPHSRLPCQREQVQWACHEGKARSAANPTRHGLASADLTPAAVCLNNESRPGFVQLHQALINEFQPAAAAQHLIVEAMAVARWRLQRAWVLETAVLDNELDFIAPDIEEKCDAVDEAIRTAPRLPLADR